MTDNNSDAELQAIQKLLDALDPLDKDARQRVIDYVFGRLGMGTPSTGHTSDLLRPPVPPVGQPQTPDVHPSPATMDIRSLKDQKQPKSAIEMAVVAAYYLSEAVPSEDRKSEISTSDMKKLFIQAVFPLPVGGAAMTLANAKNAGYLDPGSGRGKYKLNPVGHNLVAHKLPSSESQGVAASSGNKRKPKRTKKKVKKKATRKKTSKQK